MAGGDSSPISLESTPTWAVATVCFVLLTISIMIEHSIHCLCVWLLKHHKTALFDALGRLQSELMLLGFVSLLLAVTQDQILKICVPSKVASTMLPCSREVVKDNTTMYLVEHQNFVLNGGLAGQVLLVEPIINFSVKALVPFRRSDADEDDKTTNTDYSIDSCSSKGKVPLMTLKGIQQLQIFIFVLATMQIVYSIFTLVLGRAKMRCWKSWEKETQTIDYKVSNDPNRFRLTRQTSFGRRHMACTDSAIQLWIKCFFRQFFNSVAKVDYFTLRHGFIMAHLSPQLNTFDFQKYIESSLDEDFKVLVSISPLMWFLVIIFLLVDIHGWHSYLWISCIPMLTILVLGTKLEVIVAKMALQLKDRTKVVMGAPLVELKDEHFWFKRPKFVLNLLHLTLFVNAFELAFFIWVTILFGFDSCYHQHTSILITRIVLAVSVQVICSYITLPLYALVTQMGSRFKGQILKKQTAEILKQWHAEVRERRKKQENRTAQIRGPSILPVNRNLGQIGKTNLQSPSTSLSDEIREISEITQEAE